MTTPADLRPGWARYVAARDSHRTGAGLPPTPTGRERAALGLALVQARGDFSDDACKLLAAAVGCTWQEMLAALRGGLR